MTQLSQDFDYSGLSPAERITLAQELWDSVHEEIQAPPLTEEQEVEIQRRLDAIDAGAAHLVDWEEIKRTVLRRR